MSVSHGAQFVRYMSSPVRLCLSVCRLSVTFVSPTQMIEIFRNVSTPFGALAICDLSVKILRRSSLRHGVKPKKCQNLNNNLR